MANRLRLILLALAALAAGAMLRRRRAPDSPEAGGTWTPVDR